jgi:hypothetical protein
VYIKGVAGYPWIFSNLSKIILISANGKYFVIGIFLVLRSFAGGKNVLVLLTIEAMNYKIIKIQNIPKWHRKPGFHRWGMVIIFMFGLLLPPSVKTQTASYTQLANEARFASALNDEWAAELWMGGAFSNTSTEDRVLSTNIQRYFFLWAHYYLSAKWKLSSSFAYNYNKEVPDIRQYFFHFQD